MLHVPVTVEIAAADVWTYITRALTDPDSYKADVSPLLSKAHFDTELPKVPTDVWAHVTRVLTDPDSYKANISALLSKIYFDAELAKVKSRSEGTYNRSTDSLASAGDETHHTTGIFPDGSNLTLTFTAHANANEYSSWAEIVDNIGNKLSDLITRDGHITAFLIEACETKDKVFKFDIAYGDDKTMVSPFRFFAGETTKLPPIQQTRIRSDLVPAGEKIYYRMRCEQAGSKTCQLHMRYYLHRA